MRFDGKVINNAMQKIVNNHSFWGNLHAVTLSEHGTWTGRTWTGGRRRGKG
jgi:hypothetical protein